MEWIYWKILLCSVSVDQCNNDSCNNSYADHDNTITTTSLSDKDKRSTVPLCYNSTVCVVTLFIKFWTPNVVVGTDKQFMLMEDHIFLHRMH